MHPLPNETFEQCRTFWLDYIQTCRLLVRALHGNTSELAREIRREQAIIIKETFALLKAMQRERNT